MIKNFFSCGKLLITGEYLVLDGAKALAVPTKLGQSLNVESRPGSGNIHWTAKDWRGSIWLNVSFILQDNHLIPIANGTDENSDELQILKGIFEKAYSLNDQCIDPHTDYEFVSQLQFPSDWGLGSSSTLIANIAKWAEVDAITLNLATFGGSGYDVATGVADSAIIYNLENNLPKIDKIKFDIPFSAQLFFVHLGNKQNSRDEIKKYRKVEKPNKYLINQITEITNSLSECKDLESFEKLIMTHEDLISKVLSQKTIMNEKFSDYPGAIKSLGAWGGDFILVTRTIGKSYFIDRAYSTIVDWDEMIK